MENNRYRSAVEALLFASGDPVEPEQLAQVLHADTLQICKVLEQLQAEYDRQGRGICLLQLEGRWQMAARPAFASYIQELLATKKNVPLSPAALEVLAIIAYNQPVSRSFIEQVRGVDSSSTVQNLLQKGLIEEAGRLDLPGRPISFATTDVFLRTFGISSLQELPPLHQQQEAAPADAPQTPENEPDPTDDLPPEDAI